MHSPQKTKKLDLRSVSPDQNTKKSDLKYQLDNFLNVPASVGDVELNDVLKRASK